MSIEKFLSRAVILGLGRLVSAAILTNAASAETLSYTGFSVTGDSITIDTPHSGSGIAGEVHLTTTSGIVDGWCIDVFDDLQGAGTYNVGPSSGAAGSPGVPSLSSTQLGEIGALVAHGDSLVAHPGSYSSNEVAAAIQIAIWTVEYDPNFGYNTLGSPVDAAPPNPSGLVAYYLSQVGTGNPWGLNTHFDVLSYTDKQTGVSNQTLVTVPEASTWIMMLIGCRTTGD
jgi:hypothetical protein